MNMYVQLFILLPFLVVLFQFYLWVLTLTGIQRQRHCRGLGIVYTTVGTVCFLFRSLSLTVLGLVLFMLGLRLIAYGLDRMNKSIFIDRFDEDR